MEKKKKTFYLDNKIEKKCYEILYNEDDEEIYNGLLFNGIPQEGKSLIIYIEDEDYLLYKGDFESFKYNGKGILYYEKENKIKFNGIFINNNYSKGILYYRSGYKEYEGEFNENKYEGKGILILKTIIKNFMKVVL